MPANASTKSEIKLLSDYLDQLIANKKQIDQSKIQRINNLNELLIIADESLEQQYEINQKLYKEYHNFNFDSAIYYLENNLSISRKLKNDYQNYNVRLNLSVLYSSAGLFRESGIMLSSIDPTAIPKELLQNYYHANFFFYQQSGNANNLRRYNIRQEQYCDSLLTLLDPQTFHYRKYKAEQHIRFQQADEAEILLLELLEEVEIYSHAYSFLTFLLGKTYGLKQNKELEKKYFLLSAITCIKLSIKDGVSFQELASIYYNERDISNAYKYTQITIEDIISCNIQFRTAQFSKLYSIINSTYKEEHNKSIAQKNIFLIAISILSFILILLVAFVYSRMKKYARTKEILSHTNEKLNQLNDELNKVNSLLLESNEVKEQYIAQFFNLCSNYIYKMESFRTSLLKLLINDQIGQLKTKLKAAVDVSSEYNELYRHFDSVFLNLYPNFIDDFNAMLPEDKQITLKSGDLLNKELRIYALLQMGITDNNTIASFLRCSLSTIYNYRTKMNKTVISCDEFEKKMKNGDQRSSKRRIRPLIDSFFAATKRVASY